MNACMSADSMATLSLLSGRYTHPARQTAPLPCYQSPNRAPANQEKLNYWAQASCAYCMHLGRPSCDP